MNSSRGTSFDPSSPTPSLFPRSENRSTVTSLDEGARFQTVSFPFGLTYQQKMLTMQMAIHLYKAIATNRWFGSENGPNNDCHGVLLKRSYGYYACEPTPIHRGLLGAVQSLDVEVAFTMSTEATNVIFSLLEPYQTEIFLRNGSQLQILQSMNQIATSTRRLVKRYQYAALIREEQVLLVWHDDLDHIVPHAMDLEGLLLTLVC
jgi:hypothetical protein